MWPLNSHVVSIVYTIFKDPRASHSYLFFVGINIIFYHSKTRQSSSHVFILQIKFFGNNTTIYHTYYTRNVFSLKTSKSF